MSDRLVLVRVTDPDVRGIRVIEYLGYDESKEWGREVFEEVDSHLHPVPKDGQLQRHLNRVTRAALSESIECHSAGVDTTELNDSIDYVRAAFGLDTEDEE